jgi:excisionase family DNA binding protein
MPNFEQKVVIAMREPPQAPALLTPGEVARLFGVDAKTVTRWARAGQLPSLKTLGGHRRYPEREIRDLLDSNVQSSPS